MRKENSDFSTDFVTDAGDFKDNRDYFAYVELDDLACWVLARGLDSASEKLSSEIVVGSIINDFTEKPSMSKRAIKKYIKNANKVLINESRIVKLHASVLVVVSNYSTFRWANVGNTRLYHLSKDKINLKSKDHSVAQLMLEAGDIDERQLNHHIERNNLTRYLGEKKRVKPSISKKVPLNDGDVVLACTSGYWEKVNDHQIEDVVKESSDPGDFVNNLEEDLTASTEGELSNYTMVSFFASKIFKESGKKKNLYKKVAIILIPIIMLTSGYAIYMQVKKMNARKATRMLMNQRITTSVEQESNGDKLYNKGDYQGALAAYKISEVNLKEVDKEGELADVQEKIKKLEFLVDGSKLESDGDRYYEETDYQLALQNWSEAKDYYFEASQYYQEMNNDDLRNIQEKLNKVEMILKGKALEEEGSHYFQQGEYQLAQKKWNDAKTSYLKSNDYNIDNLEANINKVTAMIKAVSYEEEGNIFFESRNFPVAIEKYNSAIAVYRNYDMLTKTNELTRRIETSQNNMNTDSKLENARKIELAADEFSRLGQFEKAIMTYIEAKVIYTELNQSEKIALIESKMNKVEESRQEMEVNTKLTAAENLERDGDQLFYLSETGQARIKYMDAKSLYNELGLTDRVSQVDEKLLRIEEIKNERAVEESASLAASLEKEGDEAFQIKDYNLANAKYLEAKAIYNQLKMNSEVQKLDNKINNINIAKSEDGIDSYLGLGDIQLAEKNYDEALFNYRQARKISQENGLTDRAAEIDKIISNTMISKFQTEAEKYERAGDILLEEDNFSEALFNYKQARTVYTDNNLTDGINDINKKIENTQIRQKYHRGQEYEKEAELQFNKEEYEDALENYQKALAVYEEISKDTDIQRVTEKIELVKDKQKGILERIFDAF